MKLSIVSASISVFMTLILVSIKHYIKQIVDALIAPLRHAVNDRGARWVIKMFALLAIRLSGCARL